jgi:type 1 fimbriae regulatory protein FimE
LIGKVALEGFRLLDVEQLEVLEAGIGLEPRNRLRYRIDRLLAVALMALTPSGDMEFRSPYGHRDATMILLTYRHGLRASEVCSLRWDQIELDSGRLHVRRAKGGIDNVHPLSGKEIRALRQLRRENMESRYVFVTERGGPATTAGFLKTIARTGEAAKLPFPIHPHMLRHSTGYKLANDGHDTRALQHYMGHKNIMHTVRYTEMAPDRFKNFWKD